jgi:two-component system, NarL family, sensor kinase
MQSPVTIDRTARRAGWLRSHTQVSGSRRPVSVSRAVAEFAAASLIAVVVIGFAGVQVLRGESSKEALGDAKGLTRLAGGGIVQPVVTDGLVAGDLSARRRVDQVVRSSVLGRGIVRVKIWTAQGRIVYSDAPLLAGSVYPLSARELRSLRSGAVVAEQTPNLSLPENRFERSAGRLLDIYLPIHTPSGRALLFEAYLPANEVSASAHHLWVAFAPALFGGLVLLGLIQLPLAWSLASRLRRGQREREALLARAIEASEDERRRIARDLHDGVVQDLAGVAYSLAATAEKASVESPVVLAESLRATASQTRQSIRALRSLLVDIYPANLRSAGLEAALSDLVSGLSSRGIDARLDYRSELALSETVEALLYRVAQEGLRNVVAHAHAKHAEVSVAAAGPTVSLTVQDDGVGFSAETEIERASGGHFGLGLLADLVREHGGQLEVSSVQGCGTRVRVEVDGT